MIDGLRLALGTLTILPVPAPRLVDRRSASWAMTLAPLVGLLLAAPAIGLLLLLADDSPLLVAALVVALLTVLTRALHLDGLADTADGLGSGRPGDDALAIMRKSDIGPFGVTTLVLVLLVEVVALAEVVATGRGAHALALALVVSRLMLPVLCSAGVPAARRDGLGRAVAGTVSRAQLLLGATLGAVGLLGLVAATGGWGSDPAQQVVRAALVAMVALAVGAALAWRCVRRLGGVTGDVLGACVEVTFATALVVLALA